MRNFDRLREAAAIIDGIPKKFFNLAVIIEEYDGPDKEPAVAVKAKSCGAIGCAMGWLGMHPDFQKLGLGVLPEFANKGDVAWKGQALDYSVAAGEIFGILRKEAINLFAFPGSSAYDGNMPEDATSKQLFKNRIRMFLAEHSQPVSPDF